MSCAPALHQRLEGKPRSAPPGFVPSLSTNLGSRGQAVGRRQGLGSRRGWDGPSGRRVGVGRGSRRTGGDRAAAGGQTSCVLRRLLLPPASEGSVWAFSSAGRTWEHFPVGAVGMRQFQKRGGCSYDFWNVLREQHASAAVCLVLLPPDTASLMRSVSFFVVIIIVVVITVIHGLPEPQSRRTCEGSGDRV